MQKPEDFTKFYYTKVGLGEGCGCAERVIDVYEFNRTGITEPHKRIDKPAKRGWFRFPRKLMGLLRRKA